MWRNGRYLHPRPVTPPASPSDEPEDAPQVADQRRLRFSSPASTTRRRSTVYPSVRTASFCNPSSTPEGDVRSVAWPVKLANSFEALTRLHRSQQQVSDVTRETVPVAHPNQPVFITCPLTLCSVLTPVKVALTSRFLRP